MSTVTVYASRSIPTAIRSAVIARDGMICRRCSRVVVKRGRDTAYRPDTLHLDHLMPWAEGGEATVENLIVSCADCNLRRPRPRNIVRQSAVRVTCSSGAYFWPDGYVPPLVTTRSSRRLGSPTTLAAAVGVSVAQVFSMIHRGDLAATATSPVRIEIPEWLSSATPAQMAGQAAANAVEQREPPRALPRARSEAEWRQSIQRRRANEATAKAARRAEWDALGKEKV